MGRSKCKKPITATKSKFAGRKEIIQKLHNLNKEKQNVAKKSVNSSFKENVVRNEIEMMGGLDAYQKASKLGEARHGNFSTAKWITKELKDRCILNSEEVLELLDVGALTANYKLESQISCTSIDLNPQSSEIEKADFLFYKVDCQQIYDVVSLSLVVNFTGVPFDRGNMLKRAVTLCKINGHIVIVLPLACMTNSRYMSHDLLNEMFQALQCCLVSTHESKKLSFKIFQKKKNCKKPLRSFPKKKLHDGPNMNNFHIILK